MMPCKNCSANRSSKLPVLQKIQMRESNFSSSNKFAYEKLKWKIFSVLNCKIVNCSVGNELSSEKSCCAWFLEPLWAISISMAE